MIGELITIESHYHADHRWFLEKPWALEKSFKWLYGGLSHPVDFIRWYLPNIDEVMGYAMISSNGRKAGLKNEDTMHFIFRSTDRRIAVRHRMTSLICRGCDRGTRSEFPAPESPDHRAELFRMQS